MLLVNLIQNTADIKSTLSAARERLLKDKFFRIAGSMFEQSAVDRIISDPSASNLTCRQAATRHAKIWQRTSMANAETFADDMDILYDSLGIAITQDDVDKVEACLTRVRNRLCHHLGVVRRHIGWLKNPQPDIFEGKWKSQAGDYMLVECSGSALVVSVEGGKHFVDRVSREQFTVALGGGRPSLVTYAVADGGNVLNETRSMDRRPQRWRRVSDAASFGNINDEGTSPLLVSGSAASRKPGHQVGILSEATNSPRPVNKYAVKLSPLPIEIASISCSTEHSVDVLPAGSATYTEEIPRTMQPRSQAVLASMALDQGLTAAQYSRLCDCVTQRTFQSGSVIFTEGDDVSSTSQFYIVEQGVVSASEHGGDAHDLGSGECFGELAIISGRPRQSTVLAKSEVVLLCIERCSFWAAITGSAEDDSKTGRAIWSEVKQQMQQVHDALRAQRRGSPQRERLLQATELDIMGFEAASKDLNELAAASWRALLVSKQLVMTRQTTVNANAAGVPWRLNMLLARVVRVFHQNRVSRVKASFGQHEKIVTDVQARIRGFLERRRMRKDNDEALKSASSAAEGDIAGILGKELDFWDWPRVR